jgi:hypothetical protein
VQRPEAAAFCLKGEGERERERESYSLGTELMILNDCSPRSTMLLVPLFKKKDRLTPAGIYLRDLKSGPSKSRMGKPFAPLVISVVARKDLLQSL